MLTRTNNILALVQLPPPVHGASVMNKIVVESRAVNSVACLDVFAIQLAQSVEDLNKGGVLKLFRFLRLFFRLFFQCLCKRYKGAYVTICPTGGGFLKDSALVLILKIFRIRILYHFHGKGVGIYSKKKIFDLLYRFCFRGQYLILLSPSLYQDVDQYFDRDNVFFVPNGIDLLPVEDQPTFDGGRLPKLLYLSNMVRGKGVFVLLGAIKNLYDQGCFFEVDFAGDWFGDGEKEEFEVKMASFPQRYRDLIKYHGPVYGEQKEALFINANVFCMPSFIDTFPLVILEAMAYGKAIISTYEGAIPDILTHEETGLLCKQKSVSELAHAIKRLMENESERVRLSQNARNCFAQKFTLQRFEHNMKTAFEWFGDQTA